MTDERDKLAEAIDEHQAHMIRSTSLADAILAAVDARIAASKAAEPAPAEVPAPFCVRCADHFIIGVDCPDCGKRGTEPAPAAPVDRVKAFDDWAAKVRASGGFARIEDVESSAPTAKPEAYCEICENDGGVGVACSGCGKLDEARTRYMRVSAKPEAAGALVEKPSKPGTAPWYDTPGAERSAIGWLPSGAYLGAWDEGDDVKYKAIRYNYVRADVADREAAELRGKLAACADSIDGHVRDAAALRRQASFADSARDVATRKRLEAEAERDAALARVAALEAENARLRESVQSQTDALCAAELDLERWKLRGLRLRAVAKAASAFETTEHSAGLSEREKALNAALHDLLLFDEHHRERFAEPAPPAAIQAEAGKVEHDECDECDDCGHIREMHGKLYAACNSFVAKTDKLPDLSAPGAAEVYGQKTAFTGSKIGGGKAGIP